MPENKHVNLPEKLVPFIEEDTLYSNEVLEIISNKPLWVVQHGILLFSFIFLCIIGLSWFIQYPDIVTTSARLTSINAPKPVIATNGGKLVNLAAMEGQQVQTGDIIGFIESTANHYHILALEKNLDTTEKLMLTNEPEKIASFLNPFPKNTSSFGELQSAFQIFNQSFIIFKNYLSNGFYLNKKQMLARDMANLKRLRGTLTAQKKLQENDLVLTQKTFDANESLKKEKVISDFDYRSEQSKLISKQMGMPQINGAIISNESQQNEKQKEILELDNSIAQQQAIFGQALQTFKSQLQAWKHQFILTAPTTGKISYASFLQENQQLKTGQTVCFVNPGNSHYYAEIVIPQNNFGKIATGQKVLLKFPSYPFQEYGAVYGRIDFISHMPTDSGYIAKIALQNGLTTNYQKQIQYREGLMAQGEIITRDMRLLQKFYHGVVGQMKQ